MIKSENQETRLGLKQKYSKISDIMNLKTRKIAFVQEFLKLQSEKAISRLENILKVERQTSEKSEVLDGIKQAVKEMNLIKAGELEARDAKELIDELSS